MTALFSFDDAEFERNLAKQKEREERKSKPKAAVTYTAKKFKQKEFRKIRKEFNRPSKPHFVLPNGEICTEIYFSDGIHGAKKVTAIALIDMLGEG